MLVWHDNYDSGDLAWLLTAAVAGLVLLWPGLTLFYHGLFGRRNLAELGRPWLLLLAVLSLVWAFVAYSLAYAPSWGSRPQVDPNAVTPMVTDLREMLAMSHANEDPELAEGGGGIIGGLDYTVLEGMESHVGSEGPVFAARRNLADVPHLLFMLLGLVLFVAIPVPLLLVLMERIGAAALIMFAALWGILVYAPLVHWIWGHGWLDKRGAVDVSGALLHIGVGFSALACLLLADRRSSGDGERPAVETPEDGQNAAQAYLGTGLLWAGALVLFAALIGRADGRAVTAFVNSHLAACVGLLGGIVVEKVVLGRTTRLGPAQGAVAALAGISAGSAAIATQSALTVGVCAAAAGVFVLRLAPRSPRDVWAVFALQGLPAATGLILVGVFATSSAAGFDVDGTEIRGLVEGNAAQIGIQGMAAGAAAAWSFLGTALILGVIRGAERLVSAPAPAPKRSGETFAE